MSIRTFITAVLLMIPVFLFDTSWAKERAVFEEPTREPSVQGELEDQPLYAGVLVDEEEDEEEEEDPGHELVIVGEEEPEEEEELEDKEEGADSESDEEEDEEE